MKQDDVEEQSPDILKLGLLFEAGVDVATLGTAVTYLCFQHKLLQEYSRSYYITKSLEKTTDIKVRHLLPVFSDILSCLVVLRYNLLRD